MKFGHEQLDVYQTALQYIQWAYKRASKLKGLDRHARDQLLRASQSIPLNIAEGNGRGTLQDRRRFFEIARGSALECAAIQDIPLINGILTEEENDEGKNLLIRIVSMLTKLGKRNQTLEEEPATYGNLDDDYDNEHEK